jgi:hypothetical protein
MFWDTTHEDLDKKIRQLESRINSTHSFLGSTRLDWEPVFELMKEIQSDFNKKVRYPTKELREAAWQKFCSLRTEAHERSQKSRKSRSDYLMIEINQELRAADFDAMLDGLFDVMTLNLMKTTKEGMKEKGRRLRNAGQLLSKYKGELTHEHKIEVFERIKLIRKEHDAFWGRMRQAHEAQQRQWEQKQREFEARKLNAKDRIRANIDKNKEKLRKAEDALDRQKRNREKIRDQISSAYSDTFRDRAEGWLDEANDKIADIEASIDRIEGWIEEGRDKLNSF